MARGHGAVYSVEVVPSEGVGDDETAMRRCVGRAFGWIGVDAMRLITADCELTLMMFFCVMRDVGRY